MIPIPAETQQHHSNNSTPNDCQMLDETSHLMSIIPYYWPRFLGSWSGETGPAVGPSAARSHTDPLRSRTPPADTAAHQSTSETDSSYKQIF